MLRLIYFSTAMQECNCLTIAGSDPGGGAGIQGDLKTFTTLGAYGMAVITALTAQNTTGVREILNIPDSFVRAQLNAVFDDIEIHAAKTGMLANRDIISATADSIVSCTQTFPLVIDPVFVSTSGVPLLQDHSVSHIIEKLFPICTIVTPNAIEAQEITGIKVDSLESAGDAARRIHQMGAANVLVKGGHITIGEEVVDVLFDGNAISHFTSRRINTLHTHGGGCAISAAICVGLARGMNVPDAVALAHGFVHAAIANPLAIGHGRGPLNHLAAMHYQSEISPQKRRR
jgi:hydroxymethylpyrimidine/phosphomethylpyrimidine kinase